MGLIDSHCHITHVGEDVASLLATSSEAGVEMLVDIAMGLEEARLSVERAREHAGRIFAAVGIHPNDPDAFEADPEATMSELRGLATRPGVVGVGETGLDLYRDRAPADVQEASFRAHIELAKEVDRTLVIHCRDAHERVLAVLDELGAPERVVMHCFSGDRDYASACAERAFFCSFAGNLTYKRNEELREAARVVPDELLLVETDAPFLAPHPFRGKPNRPALLPHTVRALAAARATTSEALTERLASNTRRAFALP